MALKIFFQTLLYHTVLPAPATYDLRTDDLRWCLGIVSNILSILRTVMHLDFAYRQSQCSDCVLPVSSGIRYLLVCLPALVLVLSLVFLSTQSPSTANPPPHRHSPFTPFHLLNTLASTIGLCFFARLMAPFSRLRRVPLRTHLHAHYPLGLIALCLFSFSFSLSSFNFA